MIGLEFFKKIEISNTCYKRYLNSNSIQRLLKECKAIYNNCSPNIKAIPKQYYQQD
jgi:hypothetical protein